MNTIARLRMSVFNQVIDQQFLNIHVGTNDPLICENEIMRMDLEALCIPHKYRIFDEAEHELEKII